METGIHELTAGYALDALDHEERRAYVAHLAGCERCREELASLSQATEALAVAASGPTPSPGLRDRILAGARDEPQVVVPLASRRSRSVPILAAAAAVAAVVALAAGVWATSLSSDVDETRAALERERAATAVLADPESRSVRLQEGAGRLVVARDGRGVLVLHGLDPAPTGKTYELWIVARGAPARAGVFPGSARTDVVALEGILESGDVVAVTVEASGGVEAPTTDPIAASEPV